MGFLPNKIESGLKKLAELPKAVEGAAEDVAKGVEGAAKNVVKGVESAAQGVAKAADGFAQGVEKGLVTLTAPVKAVHLPSLDLSNVVHDVASELSQIPGALGIPNIQLPKAEGLLGGWTPPQISLPPFLQELFGTTRPEMDKEVQATADFRSTLDAVNTLPKTDPRYAQAAAHLQQAYGYSPENAPKPGTLWVSPRLSGAELPGGQVTASQFPVGTPITDPPKPTDAVFAYKSSTNMVDAEGKTVTLNSPEEYKAYVAAHRAELGITKPDGSPAGGEPVGVHLTFEGGGGLGKRYAPAFQEMYAQGIVPVSVSGTSVGAIVAGYIAAGADPKTVQQLATDPALQKFFDVKLGGSGIADGKYMYNYIDQKLRELTGVKDRPVTFADLKIPLHLPAAILSDSNPPPGKDYTDPEQRLFVFSQETTPNTPVVYAMLASGAFPGVLPTVDLVDPTSGRKLVLTDSGVFDGIPMDMGKPDLPEVGLTLQEPHSNNPNDPENQEVEHKIPAGDIDASNPISYGLNSLRLLNESGTAAKDFKDRTQPKAGEFMLAVPIFDLTDARKQDKSLIFPYNNAIDPALDRQGRQVSQDFFKGVFNELTDPKASATNLTTKIPDNLQYAASFDYDGTQYTAKYQGGDNIHFTSADGKSFDANVGKVQAEAMWLDEQAYKGALNAELKVAIEDHFDPLAKIRRDLPF